MQRKLIRGIVAGLIAGLPFGIMMQLMKAPAPDGGQVPMMMMVAMVVRSDAPRRPGGLEPSAGVR